MTVAKAVVRSVFALAFIGMGVAHFRPGPARTMAAIIPPAMRGTDPRTPARLVAFTGVCELAGGVGLIVPSTRRAAAVALMAFLGAVFPANAYAAKHPDRFGSLAIPFWPRLGAQLAMLGLLAWIVKD